VGEGGVIRDCLAKLLRAIADAVEPKPEKNIRVEWMDGPPVVIDYSKCWRRTDG
jgi:hypothetical protein